jgi:hypothetical protein
MRTWFDPFGKELLAEALDGTGRVELEFEVRSAPQRADVLYVPDEASVPARARLGLLGRMAAEAAVFELFSRTPGLVEVRACLRKQLALAARVPELNGAQVTPRLWVISTATPRKLVSPLGLRAMGDWPPGCLEAAPGLRLHVVALRELPRTEDTLLVRLLGRDSVLAEALRELEALPTSHPVRAIAGPLLIHLRLTGAAAGALRSITEEAEMRAQTKKFMDELRTSLRAEFRDEVYAEVLESVRAEQARLAERARLAEEARAQEAQLALEARAEQARLAEETRAEQARLADRALTTARHALVAIYTARFGAPPPALSAAIETVTDIARLEPWMMLFASADADAVHAAVLDSTP